jgi:hypothetical protein
LTDRVMSDIRTITASDINSNTSPSDDRHTEAVTRMCRLAERLLPPTDAALISHAVSRALAAASDQRRDIQIEAYLHAADLVTRRFGRDSGFRLAYLEQASLMLMLEGRAGESVELVREVCRINALVAPGVRDELIAGLARRTLGWCLAMAGRPSEAEVELRTALRDCEAGVGSDHHVVALIKSDLAACLLASAPGQTRRSEAMAEADSLSASAIEIIARFPMAAEDQVSQIRIARARVLLVLGSPKNALDLLTTVSSSHWGQSLMSDSSPRYPMRGVFVDAISEACEKTGDPQAAASWRARR